MTFLFGTEAREGLFGRIAVHHGLITLDQLVAATAEQSRLTEPKPLGAVLVAMGVLSEAQVQEVLVRQREMLERRTRTPSGQFLAPPTGSAATLQAAVATVGSNQSGKKEKAGRAGAWIEGVLRAAVGEGASDVHVHAEDHVRLRVHGRLVHVTDRALPASLTRLALRALLNKEQEEQLEDAGEVDLALTLPGIGRFRCNFYRQLRGIDGVFRVVMPKPPLLDDLRLPSVLARLTTFHQGLVLCTGPGRCGKSSTLAALVHILNQERSQHIITIEDPIEVLHPSLRSTVNQRQAGKHTAGFPRALRAALREDPDVIVIGEMRDLETVSLALTAAETGHLVLATLHTHSAVRTINRIIGEFPPAAQPNIRAQLSESLRAVVSQRLLRLKSQGGVVPAVEILYVTNAVANMIRENRTHQIKSALQTGASLGMQGLDVSLQSLVSQGIVEVEEAARHADDPRKFAAAFGATLQTPAILPGGT